MNRHQEGFNAKARQSTAGSRKKGKRQKKTRTEENLVDVSDPNVSIHIPKTKAEKDQERKEKLKHEIASQSESKWNSKKRRRLDKYIEKKLKDEERVLIFEKLSQSQAELPTTLHLHSSSTLGTGRVTDHHERRAREEDKEVRRALDGRNNKRKRQDDSFAVTIPDDEDESDDGAMSLKQAHFRENKEEMSAQEDEPSTTPGNALLDKKSSIGSALQKNLNGTAMVTKMATKKQKSLKHWKGITEAPAGSGAEDSETSFDSSDSENDSPGEEDDSGAPHGNSSENERDLQEKSKPPGKKLGFKEWAMNQLSAAKEPPPPLVSSKPPRPRLTEMRGPLGEDLQLPSTGFASAFVPNTNRINSISVLRPSEVQEARILLPIITEEQVIMETVLLNPVVIICGETGSGKTTQVPQFLYEAGFGTPGSDNPGIIGVTQPRRVAAMSMASRVAHELALASAQVSYQIRYDATVSPTTSIKFMTDGVLLRELATDFLLSKYSVIIIDEAHERSLNTDILIGVLSRVLKLRETMWKEGKDGARPLRLIIMSATLRVSDFSENKTLFPSPPPVINVAARQHPVTVHFNRRTSSDYVTEAIKKASKIHARLPPGGILIFLTGQNEITGVCRKLEAKFSPKALAQKRKRRSASTLQPEPSTTAQTQALVDVEAEDLDLGGADPEDLAFDVDGEDDPKALDSDEEGLSQELGLDMEESDTPMHIVPLYSLLPSEKQMQVFQPPPPGSRLVVVSTNIAETSLTIPGIRYVVDCGRAKERRYNVDTGIQSFQVGWISKASAAQRAGRAGRTGAGHCYRLYSSSLFEHYFDQFSQPEVHRTPIEGVVLQMKSMHIDAVVNFPFPTPPDRPTLQKAERVLTYLGALSPDPSGSTTSPITELGKTMSLFPLLPRFSRMLVNGQQHGCLPYIITIISALSVGDPFLHDAGQQDGDNANSEEEQSHLQSAAVKAIEAQKSLRKAYFQSQHTHASLGDFTSDLFRILSVVGAYEYAGSGDSFCRDHFVRHKAMDEIRKLRTQIGNIVRTNFPGADVGFIPKLKPPNAMQLKVLRQLLTAGFIDQVAIRKDLIEKTASTGVQYTSSKGIAASQSTPPEYVVFHEVIRTSRVWLKGLTAINPAWLPALAGSSLCTFSKPVKNLAGDLMVTPRFGPHGWELPPIKAP
ncbi:P-loop containing nucleoside triphosphate hydrolase protein [Infundibulicybe gibba]|nr:P-loop containing nucleoside triphosphate hydrolase protein [Infundibulicybe gibba]